jgi:hypothetical protein
VADGRPHRQARRPRREGQRKRQPRPRQQQPHQATESDEKQTKAREPPSSGDSQTPQSEDVNYHQQRMNHCRHVDEQPSVILSSGFPPPLAPRTPTAGRTPRSGESVPSSPPPSPLVPSRRRPRVAARREDRQGTGREPGRAAPRPRPVRSAASRVRRGCTASRVTFPRESGEYAFFSCGRKMGEHLPGGLENREVPPRPVRHPRVRERRQRQSGQDGCFRGSRPPV